MTGSYAGLLVGTADEGDTAYHGLPPVTRTATLEGLEDYAEELTGRLAVGTAQLQTIEVGCCLVPAGIMIGGWPVEFPCCDGHPVRDETDITSGGADQHRWICSGCGTVSPPQVWAMLHLQLADRLPRMEWPLPDPDEIAAHADAGIAAILAERNRSAEVLTRQKAWELERLEATLKNRPPILANPHAHQRVPLWEPIAQLGDTADAAGTGSVAFSFRGADFSQPPGSGRQWRACRVEVADRPTNAIIAARLLERPSLRTVLNSAARGTLDHDELAQAWSRQLGEPPEWVRSAAVAAEFVDIHGGIEPQRPTRGMS